MGARRLTLLRHGSAESPDLWAEDFERPLTKEGRAEAAEMARRLQQRDWIPSLMLVSPAERTWATAQILMQILGLDEKQVRAERELYLATPETIWQIIARQPGGVQHLLICAHNPGLSALASRFGRKPRRHDLPPAGLAMAHWPDTAWENLSPRSALHCDFDDPDNPAVM
jgi:phosphohistidine phosphatase